MTKKDMTEHLLREAMKYKSHVDIIVKPGWDKAGVAHQVCHRHIHFPTNSNFAVVLTARDCNIFPNVKQCFDGYTTHKLLTAALKKFRSHLLARKYSVIMDKQGNTYTVRGDSVLFHVNVLGDTK